MTQFFKGIEILEPVNPLDRPGQWHTTSQPFVATLQILAPNIELISIERQPNNPDRFIYYFENSSGTVTDYWRKFQLGELSCDPRRLSFQLLKVRNELKPSAPAPSNICKVCQKATAYFTTAEMCQECDKKYYYDGFGELKAKGGDAT